MYSCANHVVQTLMPSPKKILYIFIILLIAFFGYRVFAFFSSSDRQLDPGATKIITVDDNGLIFNSSTQAATVADFLKEKNISLSDHDQVIPDSSSALASGMNLEIRRALKIKITADGQTSQDYALAASVAGALWENNIRLGADDFTKPALNQPIQNNTTITVIRVDVREETVDKDIPYDTVSNEDDSLGWRIKKVTQKGVKGTNEITYKVVSYDGKEISRKILSQNKIKDPTSEIVTQGTYMKLGKDKEGQGTWYSYQGGLFAASTTLPRGSYAKVTNTATGQSVVVQINDYGPMAAAASSTSTKSPSKKSPTLARG